MTETVHDKRRSSRNPSLALDPPYPAPHCTGHRPADKDLRHLTPRRPTITDLLRANVASWWLRSPNNTSCHPDERSDGAGCAHRRRKGGVGGRMLRTVRTLFYEGPQLTLRELHSPPPKTMSNPKAWTLIHSTVVVAPLQCLYAPGNNIGTTKRQPALSTPHTTIKYHTGLLLRSRSGHFVSIVGFGYWYSRVLNVT